jgi:hypothetical protein
MKTADSLGNQHYVKLIEQDRQKSYMLSNRLSNTLVINGDGTNMELLRQEGLDKMDAFIAVTGSAETNIFSCLLAKHMGVKRTIAEVENMDYIHLAENIGVDTIINKKLITASRIFRFTMSEEVSSIKCLTGTEAEVMEFLVKCPCSRDTGRDSVPQRGDHRGCDPGKDCLYRARGNQDKTLRPCRCIRLTRGDQHHREVFQLAKYAECEEHYSHYWSDPDHRRDLHVAIYPGSIDLRRIRHVVPFNIGGHHCYGRGRGLPVHPEIAAGLN